MLLRGSKCTIKCGETGFFIKDCPKANVNRVENRVSESETECGIYVNAKINDKSLRYVRSILVQG